MTNKDYAEVIIRELKEDDLFTTSVYAYVAGRYPRLTIKRVFNIVCLINDIIIANERKKERIDILNK